MLSALPALVKILRLRLKELGGMSVEQKRVIISPSLRHRYTLQELLEASDYSQPQHAEAREWIDTPAAGREEI